ncbi:carboxylesterase family protein [Neorhodopirellula pilleata]|uniref:Alpha/beta hydrolase family protein n=1 Tax=Neorhodopirellula pilleata TaxID=2714738 RepID=A0A5C5ZM42_9BACT|nr:prolyl oligopeptidase family serine peptidase [Neorhodopirellula pilleata]TWT88047.1 Alpha/beta hydrolase family protein [Neorhodopirellula pilleata]
MRFAGFCRLVAVSLAVATGCGASLLADQRPISTPSSSMSPYAHAVYENAAGEKLHYRIHFPAAGVRDDSGSDATKFPLVLFLHGAGERGDDNEAQLKHGALEFIRDGRDQRFPAIVVAPQCPKEKRWVETDWGKAPGNGTFPETPSEPMKLVFELLDELVQRTDVDPSRLYVTGLSMGGYGSWYAAAEYSPGSSHQANNRKASPEQMSSEQMSSARLNASATTTRKATTNQTTGGFAAMLAICGGADPDWAGRYASTDLWAVHGDADPVVPVTRSREMIAAVASKGHSGELRYTELPGVQHDSWTATYADEATYAWLFKQTR